MRLMLIALTLLFAMPAVAATISPEDVLDDPQQEARAQAMAERLRCVVCANQSIADSEASLAIDMQRLIRRRIAAGARRRDVLIPARATPSAAPRIVSLQAVYRCFTC